MMLLLASIDGRPKKEDYQEVGEEVIELIVPVPKKLAVKKHVHGFSEQTFFFDGYSLLAPFLPQEYLDATLNRSTPSSPPEQLVKLDNLC
ncbi:unnamed protein product, partial [Brenthis ino]